MNWAETFGVFAVAVCAWTFIAVGATSAAVSIAWGHKDMTKRLAWAVIALVWLVEVALFGMAVYTAGVS